MKNKDYIDINNQDLDYIYKKYPQKFYIQFCRYKFISTLLNKEDIVTDMACGGGYSSYLFSKYSKFVYGIDMNIDFNRLQNKFSENNIKFIKGDILNLDLESLKPTAIVMNDIIEHFNLREGESIIKKYSKILNKKGKLIIGTPNRESQRFRSKDSLDVHIHEYYQEEIESVCKKYFNNIIIFSMNDEFIYPGKNKMSWFTFLYCL